jgi:hypothetical protein
MQNIAIFMEIYLVVPVGERIKLNKIVKSGYNTKLYLVLDLFSLFKVLHCLFQLSLALF